MAVQYPNGIVTADDLLAALQNMMSQIQDAMPVSVIVDKFESPLGPKVPFDPTAFDERRRS